MRDHDRPTGLRKRVLRAVTWSTAGQILDRILRLVRIIILARLLGPEDFGIFAIALIASSLLDSLTQLGSDSALIQKGAVLNEYLGTAWTLQLLRQTGLALVLALAAKPFAILLGAPEATAAVAAFAIPVFIAGFASPADVRLQIELDQRRQVQLSLAGSVTSLLATIAAAFIIHSYWAFIVGSIAGALAQVVASHILAPMPTGPRLVLSQVREISAFGKWIWLTAIAGFLATQADKAIVSIFSTAAELGIYTMASRLPDLVLTNFGRTIGSISYPVFTSMQDDKARLSRTLLMSLEIILSLFVPITVFLILLGPQAIEILLGPAWILAAAPMAWITLAALARTLLAQGSYSLRAAGHPHVETALTIARTAIGLLLAVVLAPRFGSAGVAAGMTIGILLTLPAWVFLMNRVCGTRFAPLAPSAVLIGVAILGGVGVVLAAEQLPFFGASPWVAAAIGAAATLVYAAILVMAWVWLRRGPVGTIASLMGRRRNAGPTAAAEA